MAQIENVAGKSPAELAAELQTMDAGTLQAQEITQRAAIHAMRHLQTMGITPENVQAMLAGLVKMATLVSAECKRRGLAVIDNVLAVPGEEVAAQIRRGLAGEIAVTLHDKHFSWDSTFAGDVSFVFGTWTITFFNDCDSVDYCDSCITEDGRRGAYSDWHSITDDAGTFLRQDTEPVRYLLTTEECAVLERLLKAAR